MNRFHRSKTNFQVRGSLRHVGAGTATLAVPVMAMLVAPQSARGQALTVLHTFASGTDGASPSELNEDSEGNLYGITSLGGASNLGKVFKLDPTGKQSMLYSFAGGTDGANPSSLMRDGSGNLYGTTAAGGAFGFGTIFSLDATGKESVLYSFPGGAGGANPGSVIRDGEGNLYGISSGGTSNAGMVFKLSASGQASVLYSFPSSGLQGSPVAAALTLDSQGNLYGTTSGLSGACIFQGRLGTCGTVYKLDPAGNYTLLLQTGGSPPTSDARTKKPQRRFLTARCSWGNFLASCEQKKKGEHYEKKSYANSDCLGGRGRRVDRLGGGKSAKGSGARCGTGGKRWPALHHRQSQWKLWFHSQRILSEWRGKCPHCCHWSNNARWGG